MAINVVYAPDPTLTASAAGGASGQIALAEQRRFYDQLQEQQRQFDTGMQFRAEMAALEAHLQSRAQAQQAYQFDAGQQLRYDQLGAQFQLEQQQLAAQQEAQQQVTERALAGELGAMARQREANKVRVGLAQLGAIDDALSNREITRAQADEAYGQLQEMLGFDVSALGAIAERQQQEQMQVDAEQMQAMVSGAYQAAGLDNPLPMEAYMDVDRDGRPFFSSQALRDDIHHRLDDRRQRDLKDMELRVKLQTEQEKTQATAPKEAEAAAQELAESESEFWKFASAVNAYKQEQGEYQEKLAAYQAEKKAAKEADKPFNKVSPSPPQQLSLTDFGFPRLPSASANQEAAQRAFAGLMVGSYFVMDGELFRKTSPTDYGKVPF